MAGEGFSVVRWDHWLLVITFLCVSSYGLRLSWQWLQDIKHRRQRSHLDRRLALEIHHNQQRQPASTTPTSTTPPASIPTPSTHNL